MTSASRKLLIIDDDALVRQSIVTYLTDSGFNVTATSDAPSALDILASSSYLPDLILTDLRMPNGDGLQLLQTLNDLHDGIPVIVISGAGVISDVVGALRLGARDYLIKPLVDLEVLVHSINKVLDRQDLEEENRRYRAQLEEANRELRENLRVLERAGLVRQRKIGRERHCRLTAGALQPASEWIQQYRQFWERQFDALDRFLAESQPTTKEKKQCRKQKPLRRSN